MKKTYLVYREGDAGTDEHLAVVTAAGCIHNEGKVVYPMFVDDRGRPIMLILHPWENKVRELGVDR